MESPIHSECPSQSARASLIQSELGWQTYSAWSTATAFGTETHFETAMPSQMCCATEFL